MDIDSLIHWMQGLPPVAVYATLWFVCYIENIFPPSPSDVLMLFIATLIGMGTIGHIEAIWVATFGSVMGFLTAFVVGRQFGRKWVERGKLPFVSVDMLKKVDGWFAKYGYWVIVVNRFLTGTRAVISFFAGLSNLDFARTTILCTLSALAWNVLVIELGRFLGSNWRAGESILRKYEIVMSIVLGAIVLFFLVRWLIRRRRAAADSKTTGS